jgi:hypothetical protein
VVAYPEQGDEAVSGWMSSPTLGKLAEEMPGVFAQEQVG